MAAAVARCAAPEHNDQVTAVVAILQLVSCLVSAAWISWASDRYDSSEAESESGPGCFPTEALGGGVSFPPSVFIGSGAVPALAALASAARPDMRALTALAALSLAFAIPLRVSVAVEAADEGCKDAVAVLIWDALALPLGLLLLLLRSLFLIPAPATQTTPPSPSPPDEEEGGAGVAPAELKPRPHLLGSGDAAVLPNSPMPNSAVER